MMNIVVGSYIVQIDKEDWLKYLDQSFRVAKKPCGYLCVVFGRGKLVDKSLARVLMNPPDHLLVDHIDGDTLNNQRNNLRLVTRAQNSMNSSGTKIRDLPKGVTANGSGYSATIHVKGIKLHLGQHNSPEAASEAYKKAAKLYFKEHSYYESQKVKQNDPRTRIS